MKSMFAEVAVGGLSGIGSFGRYILTGGFLFALDILVFLALVKLGGIEPFFAQLVSRVVGATVGFFGHKHFTFMQTRRNTRYSGVTQGAAYFLIGVSMLVITPFVLLGFLDITGGRLVISKLFTDIVAVIVVYLGLKIVFAAKRSL